MTLVLLLKPNGVAVTPPPPPATVTAPATGPKRVVPPRQLHRFPAGTARIRIRARAPRLILFPELGRARVAFRTRTPRYAVDLTSLAAKEPRAELSYRAVSDEQRKPADDFPELVEAAYLLTR